MVAAPSQPLAFYERVARAVAQGPYRGGVDLEWLLNSALTVVDDKGVLRGQLAEDAPTADNGLWKLFPDGTMETTWRIREGAQWHDGTPFTTDDLVFTATLVRDREIGVFRDPAYDLIDSIETPDARTITVRWKSPTISADVLFGHVLGTPIPKHLMEKVYNEDKSKVLQAPYWLTEFVGTGPFRLAEMTQGSHLLFQANPNYVLGRPKIDEIEIRIITDPATTMSNVLAGTVELTTGYGVSLESALELRDRWKDGTVQMAPDAWIIAFVQHMNPDPPVVSDIRFKRALMHGVNRQEMVETLQAGMAQVADQFLNPAEPDYKAIEPSIVRYEFDPRKSAQLIEELGYRKGADGIYRDASDQRLHLEMRTSEGLDIQVKTNFAAANAWQKIGIATEPLISSVEQGRDREWSATYTGLRIQRSPNTFEELKRYRIVQIPTPENQFVGQNAPRYASPELTDLIERYFVTVPRDQRNQVLGDIVHIMSDQLVLMGMFYNILAVVTGKRVKNVTPAAVMGSNQTWNAHLWDLQ
jgi:peptide/nickel transport system substrate-binding protein